MDDRHAAARDQKRQKKRYGPTTTNPGMRIVMRDLASKAREPERPASPPPDDQVGSTRIKRRRRDAHQHGAGDRHSHKHEP